MKSLVIGLILMVTSGVIAVTILDGPWWGFGLMAFFVSLGAIVISDALRTK